MSPSWIAPRTLSAFLPVEAGRVPALRAALARTGAGELALAGLGELHFLRLFVIDPAEDLRGRTLPARLVLSAVFDGPAEAFLDRWIAAAAGPLSVVLAHCAGFPPDGNSTRIREYLLGHGQVPNTYYIGPNHTSAGEVRAEDRLHGAIESFLDDRFGAAPPVGIDAVHLHREIREWVLGQPDLPDGPRPPVPPAIRLRLAGDLLARLALVLAPAVVLAWLGGPGARHSLPALLFWSAAFLAGAAASWFLVIRLFELVEPEVELKPQPDDLARLLALEDHGIQNPFTMLSLVRDSAFRRLNLRFTLWWSDFLSRHWWNRGELVGIGTIHFARIHQLDEGRRMLFMSDFDGSWERYLFDFLEVGAFAVVPNWTNLHGCPGSRFMLWPPADFPHRFLPFTRANQVATAIWYSALAHLTVSEKLRNARIRAGLFRDLDEAAAREWLALF